MREGARDGFVEVSQVEGLLEQAGDAAAVRLFQQVAGGEAGDQDGVQAGMEGAEDRGDVQAVDVILQHPIGHEHVGRRVEADLESLVARGRGDHVVTLARQEARQRLAQDVLVFHDQHGRHRQLSSCSEASSEAVPAPSIDDDPAEPRS